MKTQWPKPIRKTVVSILSGGKSMELFAQLNEKDPTKVADARSNYAKVNFRLRYCYITRHTGYISSRICCSIA